MFDNLLSEGIGILFTVLIVDRLLAWREARRWRLVRGSVVAAAFEAADRLLEAWEAWLSQVERHAGKEYTESSVTVVRAPLANGRFAFSEQDHRTLRRYLGDPIGETDEFTEFAYYCSGKEIKAVAELLLPYLGWLRLPPRSDPLWRNLATSLEGPTKELNSLVASYSNVVDPEVCGPVSDLAVQCRLMQSNRHGEAPAPTIAAASALLSTFALFAYFRAYGEEARDPAFNLDAWVSWEDGFGAWLLDRLQRGVYWLVPPAKVWLRRNKPTPWELRASDRIL